MEQRGIQEKTFSCSICLELLKDPVTTPCGHSYCMNCINKHWNGEDQRKIYSCPVCRKPFNLRPDLGKSTTLAYIIEQLEKIGPQAAPDDHCYAGPEDVACDVCTGRKLKALKSCLVCLASYCENHLQPHYDVAPLKKHKLVDPLEKLQENICSHHGEVMKMFCRTDQQSICYLCSVDEHKGHDTVSAAAERTERQRELEVSRQQIQQRIQDREKDVKLLQQEVGDVNHSADKAVEDSEEIFTELIRLFHKRSSDVKQQIRSQQETEVSRVKELQEKLDQEITELKRKDAELKKLSHTEDHNQFLHNYCSLSQLSEPTDSSSIDIRPLRYFGDVTAAVSELRDQLQDILRDKWTNISLTGTDVDVLLQEPEQKASSHIPFTPELLNDSGAISYRFTCPGPGVFQCKLTKLMFTMVQEGEVLYRTVRWDENRLQSADKRPAGPLFKMKCAEDAVSKLHFPHCEINPEPLFLSVVHISDDRTSFLKALEITDTHVVVDVPHLSTFGLVWDIITFFSPNPKPVRGQVLLFHQPAYKNQSPKLYVFLLPDNVPWPEVKQQQQQHGSVEYIEAPSSCELIEGQTYSLHCSGDHKVLPKEMVETKPELKVDFHQCERFNLIYGPNYNKMFEIQLTPGTDEVTVKVQDQEEKDVWEYPVELTGKNALPSVDKSVVGMGFESREITDPDEYSDPRTIKICKFQEEERRKSLQKHTLSSISQDSGSALAKQHLTCLESSYLNVNSQGLRKDAGDVDSMFIAGPSSATGMRKDWHENVIEELRNYFVRELAHALPPTPGQVVDARNIEGDIYESANNDDEYCDLLKKKISKIQEEKKQKRLQKVIERLRSATMAESPTEQPPCDSNLTMNPRTKLHRSADETEVNSPVPMKKRRMSAPDPEVHPSIPKRSASLGTINTTNQGDAGNNVINAQNGSVVTQPHFKDVHAAGNININVNNTYSGPDPRRENLQRTQSLSGEEEKRLHSVRKEFIKRVSDPVLNHLLDALMHDNIINHGEMESIKVKPRADKARELIDMVLNKGNQACKIMIDTLCEVDSFLSKTLQLMEQ